MTVSNIEPIILDNDISVSMRCSFCVTQIVNLSGGNKDDSK